MKAFFFITTVFLLMLFVGNAFAEQQQSLASFSGSTVTRTFSTPVAPGTETQITLTITVNSGDTIFGIEENVPLAFTVTDKNAAEQNVTTNLLAFLESNAKQGTYVYIYKVRAPQTEGAYTFSGKYLFETDTSSTTTNGNSLMIVTTTGETQCTGTQEKCEGQTYFTCNTGYWENKGLVNGKCGYTTPECTNGAEKCEGTNYYLCEGGEWHSIGNVNGKCGYTTPPNNPPGGGGGGGGGAPSVVTCSIDSNCGKNSFQGAVFCAGNTVKQNYKEYKCINPGKTISFCDSAENPKTIKECTADEECKDGQCIKKIISNPGAQTPDQKVDESVKTVLKIMNKDTEKPLMQTIIEDPVLLIVVADIIVLLLMTLVAVPMFLKKFRKAKPLIAVETSATDAKNVETKANEQNNQGTKTDEQTPQQTKI